MTNADYIKSIISDVDIAWMLSSCISKVKPEPGFIYRAHKVWRRWAKSTSSNKGNTAKGKHGKTEIKEDPSVWYWEEWIYHDDTWRRSGRTKIVSMQVWLSMQYKPEEWEETDAD